MINEKKVISITGSGGGGGKGKGGGDEATNTLRSSARARIVDLISEGEIVGLVNGEKSIYFDQTPVMGTDGSYNIKGVTISTRLGTVDQTHFNNVPTVDTPVSVEVQVKKNEPAPIRTISDVNADAVRVVMRIPALLQRNKKSGAIEPTSVRYAIDVRPSGGTWAEVINQNIVKQKTSSPYQKAHYIPLPLDGAPWDIRVRRITDDSTTTDLQNETWWEAYFILVEGKFIYPHSALVYTEVDAEKFGQQIPQRYYHVKGRTIKVPVNYDPETRVYTGIWNGTFKTAWTNNPAWIFYDLVTHDRYGLGEFINATKVDKWSLYQIAQYCDQLIPSGYTDENNDPIMEPRFTFNGVINSREEAYTVLQSVINTWRGMAYWSLGQVFATADMPSDFAKLVAPADVIDGNFSYSGTSIKSRHSVAIVQWNDPNDFYRPSYEVVINDEMVQRFGWRETEVTLRGCTSRGLAHRYGRWILDVEQNETETVEYSASWDHADIRPGDIVAIADPKKAGVRAGGRVIRVEPDNKSVLLDGDYAPSNGVMYSLMAELEDGTITSKTITNFIQIARDPNSDLENFISMMNGTVGVIGGSGQLPSGWIATNDAGITKEVVAIGNLSDGRPYIDIKISGTNSSGVSIASRVYMVNPGYGPYTAIGDVWTFNCGVTRIAGSLAGFQNDRMYMYLRDSDGSALGSYTQLCALSNIDLALGSEKVINSTRTVSDVATDNIIPYVSMVIDAGDTVDVTFRIIAPQLETGAVTHDYIGSATYSKIVLDSAYTTAPINGAMWVITSTEIAPRQYRVLGISEEEPNVFKISALFHDPTKYARIEQDLILPPPTYYKPPNTIAPPSNLNIQETQYVKDGKTYSRVLLSWTPAEDFMSKAYRVSMDTPDGSNIKLGDTSNTSIDIDDISAGDYTFYVSAVGMSGRVSSAVPIDYTAAGWTGTANPFVSDLQIEGQGTNTSFGGNSVRFTWKNNLAGSNQINPIEEESNGGSSFYRDNIVKIYDTTTNTLLRTQNVSVNNYTYSYDRNFADNAAIGKNPTRSFRVEVAVRDTLGRTSVYVPLSVSNAVPDVPTFTVSATTTALIVNIDKPVDQDFSGVRVWASTVTGFNPNAVSPVYDGPSTNVTIPAVAGTTYFVRVAAYDSFDKFNLNVSPETAATTPLIVVDTVPPAVPTGLAVTSNVVISSAGQEQVKLVVTWNANSESDLAYYGVAIKEDANPYVSLMAETNRWESVVRAGVQYTVKIRALDVTGNASSYCAEVSHTAAKDTVPPATPTGFTAQAGFKSNWLSWNANTESDLKAYEIYASATTTAPVVGTVATFTSNSTVLEHSGLAAGTTRNYWIRAIDNSGNKSAWSSMISATTVNVLAPDVQGIIDMTSFASAIRPPRVVSVLPTLPSAAYISGDTVVLTTDNQLYRTNGTTWTAAVPAANVTGQLVASQIADATLTTAKFASNIKPIEIVSTLPTLPNANYPANVHVTLSSDGKLYRSTGTTWTTGVAAVDISGTLTNAQIAALEASKITGQLTNSQIADLAAAKLTGQLVASQIANASITTAKFANNIKPIEVVGSLPTLPNSSYPADTYVTLTTNGKLYRSTGSAWVTGVASTDISGTITAAQIAGIEASKVTGQLTSDQIAALDATKISGQIITNQIADAALTVAKFASGIVPPRIVSSLPTLPNTSWPAGSTALLTTDSKLYRTVNGTTWIKTIDGNDLVANSIVAGKIAAGAISAADIAADAITAEKIAAGTITAAEIASATITGAKIAAATISAANLVANTITANQIAAGAITASELAAGSVVAGKIAAGAIQATDIAAATITGDKVAANTISASNIVTNTITAAQIAVGAIGASEIAAGSITASKLFIGDTSNAYPDYDFRDASFYSSESGAIYNFFGTSSGNRGRYGLQIEAAPTVEAVESEWSQCEISADFWAEVSANLGSTQTAAEVANAYIDLGSVDSGGVVTQTRRLQIISRGTTSTARAGIALTTASAERRFRFVFERAAGGSAVAVFGGPLLRRRANGNLIVDGAITATHIAAATITGAKIAADTITATNIAAGTITATELAAGSVTTAKLAAGSVVASTIAANTITAAKIAANTITANEIATGTITANEIAADTITGAKIAAGAISASEIAAGAVIASKMVLGDFTNRCEDPHFGEGGVGWVAGPGVTFVNNQASAYVGNYYAKFGSGASGIALRNNNIFPVVPSEIYLLSATAKSIGSPSASLSCRIRYMQADKSTHVSTSSITFTSADNTYQTKSVSTTVPAGAVYAWIDFAPSATLTADSYAVGFVSCQRKATGSLIVDGTITASNIAANTITAAQIAADTITSNEIATNAITAGKIAAGAIGATQIAAGAIVASKLLVADTSNVYPDYDFRDPNFYSSSTSSDYSFFGTSVAARGRNGLRIEASASTERVESEWSQCEVSADFWAEVSTNLSISPTASEASIVHVEFGSIDASGAVTATRQVTVLTQTTTSTTRAGVAVTTASNERRFRFVFERAAGGSAVAVFGGPLLRRRANGNLIVDGAISANHLVTGTAVITGTAQIADAIISSAKISDLAVTNAKIANATIDSAKISSITADKIVVSGSTTVADWRLGSGATIDGAKIAANTILANSLIIGIRGIEVESIEFEHNSPSTNQVEWTTGTIRYVNDAGTVTSAAITASSATWSTGVMYIYWTKAATTLSTTTSSTTAFGANNVVLAVYKGGTDLVVDYGRVIIDGGKIKANTITASQISAGAIGATQIAAGVITATHIAAATITAAKIAANTITANEIATNTITAAKIAAGAITVDKLAIGDFKNLFSDGTFKDGTTANWYGWPAELVLVDRSTLTGTPALAPSRYIATIDRPIATAVSAYGSTNAVWIPCKAGDKFYISVDALSSASITETNKARLMIYWLKVDGTSSSTSFYYNPTTAWATYGTTITAVTDAVGMRVRIYFDATTTEDSKLYLTNFFCGNVLNGGVMIEDGTITATKLSVSTLSAISADVGTITAGLIKSTDNKFKLDLANKRIVITD